VIHRDRSCPTPVLPYYPYPLLRFVAGDRLSRANHTASGRAGLLEKGIVSFWIPLSSVARDVMVTLHFSRCTCTKRYRRSTAKRRSSSSRDDFRPHRLPLYLTRDLRKAIIIWFVLEQSSQTIVNRTGIGRKRVLRALAWIRQVLEKDVPEVYSVRVRRMIRTGVVAGTTSGRQSGTWEESEGEG
jgi:hypothetical protein